MKPIKTLAGILGAALLTFGCGDDDIIYEDAMHEDAAVYEDVSEDSVEDSTAEETTEETAEVISGFTFDGVALYCKRHEDEMSTCLGLYVDTSIESEQILSGAGLDVYADRVVKIGERRADSASLQYIFTSEICIGGVGAVTGVDLVAEDVYARQGRYPLQEDCEALDEMLAKRL